MKFLTLLSLIGFAMPAWATVSVGSCPQAFEGKVKTIAEELGPRSAFSTQKVIFANKQTLKGELPDQVLVDMLTNGPFEVKTGKDYRVHLRKGKLCRIEAI